MYTHNYNMSLCPPPLRMKKKKVLFLGSARVVSVYESAETGAIVHSPRARTRQSLSTQQIPAFTTAHGHSAKKHVEYLAKIGVKVLSVCLWRVFACSCVNMHRGILYVKMNA